MILYSSFKCFEVTDRRICFKLFALLFNHSFIPVFVKNEILKLSYIYEYNGGTLMEQTDENRSKTVPSLKEKFEIKLKTGDTEYCLRNN